MFKYVHVLLRFFPLLGLQEVYIRVSCDLPMLLAALCRFRRPASAEDSLSETEEGDQCQAENIALKYPAFTQSLAITSCTLPSVGEPLCILDIDEPVSKLSDLSLEGGRLVFRCCGAHRNEYLLGMSKRACAIQDCNRAGTLTPGGIRLCSTHASEALIKRYDTDNKNLRKNLVKQQV